MTTHLDEVRRMGEDEIARFTDPRFGGVMLPGQRTGRDYTASRVGGDSETDPKFAPMDHRGRSLRQVFEQMLNDPEVVKRIADETGDPAFVDAVREERELAEAKAFLAAHPSYYGTEYNYELLRHWLTKRNLQFTRENLARAYKVLLNSGDLEVPPHTPRPLTEHDRRAIALQAASGDVEGAVTRYLLKRLPEKTAELWQYCTSNMEALDDVARPEFAEVIEEAVFFCWENGRPNYMPTQERRRFLREYVAGRIPNARLLDQAWAACQIAERDAMRNGLLSQLKPTQPKPPSQADLDDLSDEAMKDLYLRTRRQIAKDARRPVGVLQ